MKKKIFFKKTIELSLPAGSKVITNDGEWLTLARKTRGGNIDLITLQIEEAEKTDFNNENLWTEFRRKELIEILKQIK